MGFSLTNTIQLLGYPYDYGNPDLHAESLEVLTFRIPIGSMYAIYGIIDHQQKP